MYRFISGAALALVLMIGAFIPVFAQGVEVVEVEEFETEGQVGEVERWYTSSSSLDDLHMLAVGASIFATQEHAAAAFLARREHAAARLGQDGPIEWLSVVDAPEYGEDSYAFFYIFDMGDGQLINGVSLVVRSENVIHNWAGWGGNPKDEFVATAQAALPLNGAVDVDDQDAVLALLAPADSLPDGFAVRETLITRLGEDVPN